MIKFAQKHKYPIVVGIILLTSAILRLYHITFMDLWRDEAFTVNISKFSIAKIIEFYSHDTQPPLHPIFLYFWMKIFGDSEFSVRFPSFIAGLSTVFLIIKLAEKVFEERRYVLLSGILASVNPLLIIYSQEARSYSFLCLFSVCVVYFALQINEKSSSLNLILFIISSLFGLYTHNIFVVVLISIYIFKFGEFLLRSRLNLKVFINTNRNYLIQIALSIVVIGIFYLPWLIVFIEQYSKISDKGFWLFFEPVDDLRNNFIWFFVSQNYKWGISGVDIELRNFIASIGAVLSLGGIAYAIIKRKNYLYISYGAFFMLTIVFIISFKTPFFFIRYLIFVAPLVLINVVQGASLTSKINRYLPDILIVIFSILTLVFYFRMVTPNVFKEEYSKLATTINYNEETDLIIHPHVLTFHGLKHYLDHPQYIYDPEGQVEHYEGISYLNDEDYFNGDLREYERLWIPYMWYIDETDVILKKQGFTKLNEWRFNPDQNFKLDLWVKSEKVSYEVAK